MALITRSGVIWQLRTFSKQSFFDREIAQSARGPTSGSYGLRTFVLFELYDAILL